MPIIDHFLKEHRYKLKHATNFPLQYMYDVDMEPPCEQILSKCFDIKSKNMPVSQDPLLEGVENGDIS